MNGPNSLAGVGAVTASPAAHHSSNARFHRAAQQFQAMFMGEMLRMAHPASKATGVFAAGDGEKVWQGFMDQALGEAVDKSQRQHRPGPALSRRRSTVCCPSATRSRQMTRAHSPPDRDCQAGARNASARDGRRQARRPTRFHRGGRCQTCRPGRLPRRLRCARSTCACPCRGTGNAAPGDRGRQRECPGAGGRSASGGRSAPQTAGRHYGGGRSGHVLSSRAWSPPRSGCAHRCVGLIRDIAKT